MTVPAIADLVGRMRRKLLRLRLQETNRKLTLLLMRQGAQALDEAAADLERAAAAAAGLPAAA